jgi:hypothetical protein
LLESLSDDDMSEIALYLNAKRSQIIHPMFLATMLLDLLVIFYSEHRKGLENSLFVLESHLGITRGRRQTDAWDWDYELYKDTTKQCNGVYTNLVYLERRLDFALRLGDFILESLKYCDDNIKHWESERLQNISRALRETVQNSRNFVGAQLHQTLCLQKRSQALTTVVRKFNILPIPRMLTQFNRFTP